MTTLYSVWVTRMVLIAINVSNAVKAKNESSSRTIHVPLSFSLFVRSTSAIIPFCSTNGSVRSYGCSICIAYERWEMKRSRSRNRSGKGRGEA